MASTSSPATSDTRDSLHISRRAFLGMAGATAAGLALYAGEVARHELVVEQRTIRLPGLSEAFAGMRIAQISDLHYAEYTEPFFVRRVVERINRMRPDMVLLTGDFVSMGPVTKFTAQYYAEQIAELLGGIQCPHRYGVLGNHDWMVNGTMVTATLKSVGIPLLVNQNVPIERGGARFWLAGMMDALSWESNLSLTLPKNVQEGKEPVILMVHEPDVLPEVARSNAVDLMLSGHTHGGQVRLPFLPPLFLPALGKRFVAGHFQMGRTQLYVNRGIGAVGLPFRFRCPAEITEITLQPA